MGILDKPHTVPTSKRLLLPSYFSDSLFVKQWCSLTVVVKKIRIRFFVSYQTHLLVSSSVNPGKWNTSKTPENAPFRIQGRGPCDSGNCWGSILSSASVLISSNRQFCLEIQLHKVPRKSLMEEIPLVPTIFTLATGPRQHLRGREATVAHPKGLLLSLPACPWATVHNGYEDCRFCGSLLLGSSEHWVSFSPCDPHFGLIVVAVMCESLHLCTVSHVHHPLLIFMFIWASSPWLGYSFHPSSSNLLVEILKSWLRNFSDSSLVVLSPYLNSNLYLMPSPCCVKGSSTT